MRRETRKRRRGRDAATGLLHFKFIIGPAPERAGRVKNKSRDSSSAPPPRNSLVKGERVFRSEGGAEYRHPAVIRPCAGATCGDPREGDDARPRRRRWSLPPRPRCVVYRAVEGASVSSPAAWCNGQRAGLWSRGSAFDPRPLSSHYFLVSSFFFFPGVPLRQPTTHPVAARATGTIIDAARARAVPRHTTRNTAAAAAASRSGKRTSTSSSRFDSILLLSREKGRHTTEKIL